MKPKKKKQLVRAFPVADPEGGYQLPTDGAGELRAAGEDDHEVNTDL